MSSGGLDEASLDGARRDKGIKKSARAILSRLRAFPPEVWIFFFYLAFTLFLTWPLIIHLRTSVYGYPGDNLGAIWMNWWVKNAGAMGGSATFSPMIGYPFGSSLGFPLEPLVYLESRFLLLFTNEVVAWNLDILLSFFLSGLTMYYLVRYLTRDRRVAFFGGFAWLVGVFHAYNAMWIGGGLAATQWIPLYVLLLLKYIKRPGRKSAVYLALGGILVACTSIHFAYFMGIFTSAFLVGRFVYFRIKGAWKKRSISGLRTNQSINRRTTALSLGVFFAVIVCVLLFFTLFVLTSNPAGKWPTSSTAVELRIPEYIDSGVADPLQYLLPNTLNPVFGGFSERFVGDWQPNFENEIYLGWILIILALTCAITWRARRRPLFSSPSREEDQGGGRGPPLTRSGSLQPAPLPPEDQGGRRDPPLTRGARGVLPRSSPARGDTEVTQPSGESRGDDATGTLWGFAAAGVTAFLFSLKTSISIGSVKIPLPSRLSSIFMPWLRWYSRFSIVVSLCLIVIACFGLQMILSRIRLLKGLVVGVVTVFLAVEMVMVPPFRNFDFSFKEIPPVFHVVKRLEKGTGLAFYPMKENGPFITSRLMFYQRYFKKSMINGATSNSDGEAMRRTVYNPYHVDTPGILKRLGIGYMVFFTGKVEGLDGEWQKPSLLPAGLHKIFMFHGEGQFGSGCVYRVTAPPAEIVPLYLNGIFVPFISAGGVTKRVIDRESIIRLENYSGHDRKVGIKLLLRNPFSRREFSITKPDGTILYRDFLNKNQEGILEMRNLVVLAQGINLKITVSGSSERLTFGELRTYGTSQVSLEIGDVNIIYKP